MHRHSILLLALLATLPGVHSFGSLQYLRPGGAQVPGPYTAMMHEDLTPVNAGVDLGVEGAHAPQLTYNGGELEVSVVDGKIKVRQNPKVLAPPPPPPPSPPAPPPPFERFSGGACTGCIAYGCEEYMQAEAMNSLADNLTLPSNRMMGKPEQRRYNGGVHWVSG